MDNPFAQFDTQTTIPDDRPQGTGQFGPGTKYTPEQMQEFDRRRNALLNDPITTAYDNVAGDTNPFGNFQNAATTVPSVKNNSDNPFSKFEDKKSSIVPKNPLADIVGGTAAGLDFIAPLGSALGGASAALGMMLPKGLGHLDLSEAVKHIEHMSAYNLGSVLEKYYPEAYQQYLQANAPAEKLGEFANKAGETVAEKTHSPLAGTATNLFVQVLPFILGERALAGTVGKGAHEIADSYKFKDNPKASAYDNALGRADHEAAVTPEKPTAAPTQPYDPSLEAPLYEKAQQDAMARGFEPEQANPYAAELNDQFYSRQGNLELSPDNRPPVQLDRGQSAELFPEDRTAIPDVRDSNQIQAEANYTVQQPGMDFGPDKAARPLINIEPKSVPDQAPLFEGSRTAQLAIAKSQRGQADMINDLAKKIYDLAQGTSRLVREGPFKEGDTVRLMNGKVAIIQKVTSDERGNPRYQVKNKDGSFDSIPRQGINYAYKPAGIVENPVGYTSQINKPLGGVGKKGFGQGGSFDIKSFLRDQNLNKETDGTPKDLLMRTSSEFQNEMINQNHWKHEIGAITKVPKNHKLYGGMPYRITEHNWLSLRGEYQYRGDVLNPDGSIKRVGLPIKQHYLEKSLGQTQIGKNQMGAIDLRAMFGRDPKKVTSPDLSAEDIKGGSFKLDSRDIVDTLYRAWNMAKSPETFADLIQREMRLNTEFPKQALADAQKWWDKFENGYRPQESTYGSMSKLNRRDSMDMRPYEQMVKESPELQKKLEMSDDIGYVKRELLPPAFATTMNAGKAGTTLTKWAYGNLVEIRMAASHKLSELMNYKDSMLNLPRKSQLNVFDAQRNWDYGGKYSDELVASGKMYPDEQMLMDKGLNRDEAKAYLDQATAFKEGYRIAGIKEPPIPGYFPHTWKGYWKVYVMNDDGLVKVMPANTRMGAKKIVAEMQKEGFMTEIREPQLNNRHSFVQNAQDIAMAMQNGSKMNTLAAKQLLRAVENALRGNIVESFERHGVGGFAGEFGAKPENTFAEKLLNRGYNNNLFRIFDNSMQDFARAYRNQMIKDTVLDPVFKDIDKYQKLNNSIGMIKDMASRATGFSTQEFGAIERSVRATMIRLGLPPNIPSNILGSLNDVARFMRINSANLGFAAEHGEFALPGIIDMYRMHMDRFNSGERTGNLWKAIGTFGKEAISFGMMRSPEMQSAMDWFKSNKGYESNYYSDVLKNSTSNQIKNLAEHKTLELVINRAKSVSFAMAYSYFKDIMPKQEALKAAKQHTMKTMQSFDTLDTPEVFMGGMVGKTVRPFNQIHFYNVGRHLQALESIKIAAENDWKKIPLGMTSIGSLLVLNNMLGGAKGITFNEDWELIRKWLNDNTETYWPSITETMYRSDLPEWMIYGILPLATGMDTRGTFTTNLSDMFSGAGVELGYNFGKLAYLQAKKHLTGEVNPDSLHAAKEKLYPTVVAKAMYENKLAEERGGNIQKQSRLEPLSPRTPEERAFNYITSKKPISESMRNEKLELLQEIEAANQRYVNRRTNMIVNKLLGADMGTNDVGTLIAETIKADRGANYEDLAKNIEKRVPEKLLPAAINYLEKVSTEVPPKQAVAIRNMLEVIRNGKLGQ